MSITINFDADGEKLYYAGDKYDDVRNITYPKQRCVLSIVTMIVTEKLTNFQLS